MKLVVHPPLEEQRLSLIRQAAGDMLVVNAQSPAEAIQAIVDADAFFGKMTPELLARAGRLRWVQSPTASLEHYLFPALIEHPCQLTNMRGLFSDVIADQVMGYVLCFARNLHTYIRQQAKETFEPVGGNSARASFSHGPGLVNAIDLAHQHLSDQVMGIVGLGAIGSEVRHRAEAFGIEVLAVDPVNPAAWKLHRLPELLERSDYLVIAAPHTPSTEKMFRAPQFSRMKQSAVLINIGRGAIVDISDLAGALRQGVLAGAALDVFEVEPLPKGHPLWQMPNVIITPHVAGYSPRIAERHLDVLLDNVGRFARGEELRNPVNKAEWF